MRTKRIWSDEDLRRYRVARVAGAGYDLGSSWEPIYAWGSRGWDLGDLPYVVFRHRYVEQTERPYQLCEYVEGDLTFYAFPTKEEMHEALDHFFLWYGLGQGYEDWVDQGLTWEKRADLEAGELVVPEELCGPYRGDAMSL